MRGRKSFVLAGNTGYFVDNLFVFIGLGRKRGRGGGKTGYKPVTSLRDWTVLGWRNCADWRSMNPVCAFQTNQSANAECFFEREWDGRIAAKVMHDRIELGLPLGRKENAA